MIRVGDTVRATFEGKVLHKGAHGVWVARIMDGPSEGLNTYVYEQDCVKVSDPPQPGEVWVHEDGTRGFMYFNYGDRLQLVTTHGRVLRFDDITEAKGWSKAS